MTHQQSSGEGSAALRARTVPLRWVLHSEGRLCSQVRSHPYDWYRLHRYVLLAQLAKYVSHGRLVHGVGRPRQPQAANRTSKCRSACRLLAEQHRIVEAIESYFTRLDDAVASLERVQRNLKRYRASVLKAAVEGRLVPTEAELARAGGPRLRARLGPAGAHPRTNAVAAGRKPSWPR